MDPLAGTFEACWGLLGGSFLGAVLAPLGASLRSPLAISGVPLGTVGRLLGRLGAHWGHLRGSLGDFFGHLGRSLGRYGEHAKHVRLSTGLGRCVPRGALLELFRLHSWHRHGILQFGLPMFGQREI